MFATQSDVLRDAADRLSVSLLEYCPIESVYIFGSVSRRQARETSDVDLILTVDNETHERWLQLCAAIYEAYMGPGTPVYFGYSAATRLLAATKSVAFFENVLEAQMKFEPTRYALDVLVLPTDWRQRLPELQSTGEHRDPDFMQKIDEDAFLIASRRAWKPAVL